MQFWLRIHPLSLDSDQHQISPCNMNALLIREVMGIKDMIIQDKLSWYLTNFSPLVLWEMSGNKEGEFVFWYWGLKAVKNCIKPLNTSIKRQISPFLSPYIYFSSSGEKLWKFPREFILGDRTLKSHDLSDGLSIEKFHADPLLGLKVAGLGFWATIPLRLGLGLESRVLPQTIWNSERSKFQTFYPIYITLNYLLSKDNFGKCPVDLRPDVLVLRSAKF